MAGIRFDDMPKWSLNQASGIQFRLAGAAAKFAEWQHFAAEPVRKQETARTALELLFFSA
jgi:hypothetical protein